VKAPASESELQINLFRRQSEQETDLASEDRSSVHGNRKSRRLQPWPKVAERGQKVAVWDQMGAESDILSATS
jgi:hypothetical protein